MSFTAASSFRVLIVSGCDASKLFDLVEEELHEVPLPIDLARENEMTLPVGLRRDVGSGHSLGGLGPDGITVVALVRHQDVSLAELVRQRVGLGAVGDLPAGQTEVDGATFGVDTRAWILLVSPPRERPIPPSSPSPFFPWPRAGERGHSLSRS